MQCLKCIHGTNDVVDFGNLEACQGILDQQVKKSAIIDNQDPEILQIEGRYIAVEVAPGGDIGC